MRRVIDGRAYNTETAQVVARTTGLCWEQPGDGHCPEIWSETTTLYRTKTGLFFFVDKAEPDRSDREIEKAKTSPQFRRYHAARVRAEFYPATVDEAYAFVRDDAVELLAEGIFPTVKADAELRA